MTTPLELAVTHRGARPPQPGHGHTALHGHGHDLGGHGAFPVVRDCHSALLRGVTVQRLKSKVLYLLHLAQACRDRAAPAAPPRSVAEDTLCTTRAGDSGARGNTLTVTSSHLGAGLKQSRGTGWYLVLMTKPRGCAASPGNCSICLIMLAASKLHFLSKLNLSNLNFQAQL